MMTLRGLTFAASVLCGGALLDAADLSQYRDFDLNSNLTAVAQQAQMRPGEAETVHRRPALIQVLTWTPGGADSVRRIRFAFFDGELFRMVVEYDFLTTRGLTAQDLTSAISATYGDPVPPTGQVVPPARHGDSESAEVLTRWEDSKWSYNLVRFKYESTFSLVALSKRLATPAQAAIVSAVRLDVAEAPSRRLEQERQEEEKKRLREEEARMENREGFRP